MYFETWTASSSHLCERPKPYNSTAQPIEIMLRRCEHLSPFLFSWLAIYVQLILVIRGVPCSPHADGTCVLASLNYLHMVPSRAG